MNTHGSLPLLQLRNQLASSRAYMSIQNALRAWGTPKAHWQRNRVEALESLDECSRDAFVALHRGGRLRWSVAGARCLNRRLTRLPWWWYRDVVSPDLGLITLTDALVYREDGLPWGPRRKGPEDWRPFYGYVWTKDGLVVEECMRATSPPPHVAQAGLREIRRQAEAVGGTYLFLGWLAKVYGHFLLESLSHLWPLLMSRIARESIGLTAFIMDVDRLEDRDTGRIPEFLARALSRFDIDLAKVLLVREPIVFERLLVPTPSFSLVGHSYGTALQGSVWDAIQGGRQGVPRSAVYLSRRGYQLSNRVRRPLLNEGEVEALFREYGFEIVNPETLSFREQLSLYGRCSVLAGTVGSNMHNSAFMAPGTRVLIIAPTGFVPQADCLINAPRGIKTGYFFSPADDVEFDSSRPWELDLSEFQASLNCSGFLGDFGTGGELQCYPE